MEKIKTDLDHSVGQNKLIVECSWQDEEFVKMVSFEEEEDVTEVYLTIVGAGMDWKSRLKAAWGIIRRGEYENFGTMHDEKNIREIIDYLQKVLNSWK